MLVLPRVVVNAMFDHAQRVAPEECVGVLSGSDGIISTAHVLSNSLRETTRFLVDHQEQIDLFRRLRETGKKVMAIYHSHPDGAPEPSERDLEFWRLQDPGLLYLIVFLGVDGRLEMNGYLLQDGRVAPQSLEIGDS